MKRLRRIVFNFLFYMYEKKVKESTSPLAYPLLTWMEFNKESLFEKWIQGETLKTMIIEHAEDLPAKASVSLHRQLYKSERRAGMDYGEWVAICMRYERYCNYI